MEQSVENVIKKDFKIVKVFDNMVELENELSTLDKGDCFLLRHVCMSSSDKLENDDNVISQADAEVTYDLCQKDEKNSYHTIFTDVDVEFTTISINTRSDEVISSNIDISLSAEDTKKDEDTTSEESDGYHSFQELYDHRSALFVALCNILGLFDKYIAVPKNDNVAYVLFPFKTWKYNDGTDIEDGFFLAGITVAEMFYEKISGVDNYVRTWPITARVNGEYQFKEPVEITYHCEGKWWDNFKVKEREKAREFDGYTSQDVLDRILKVFTSNKFYIVK